MRGAMGDVYGHPKGVAASRAEHMSRLLDRTRISRKGLTALLASQSDLGSAITRRMVFEVLRHPRRAALGRTEPTPRRGLGCKDLTTHLAGAVFVRVARGSDACGTTLGFVIHRLAAVCASLTLAVIIAEGAALGATTVIR